MGRYLDVWASQLQKRMQVLKFAFNLITRNVANYEYSVEVMEGIFIHPS